MENMYGMNNRKFNREGLNLLLGIADSLLLYAKHKNMVNIDVDFDNIDGEREYLNLTVEEMQSVINTIFELEPQIDFNDYLD